ncbi:MAG TPA: D-Ala-D-Ala carboxypeptidase family metallohydrolase [Hyphomicrobiaceae bacterium]|nr:D-Ala-D-Ala carboxypeptidase family metallohydrolase [Hyphomicrobiaceae bacterium]
MLKVILSGALLFSATPAAWAQSPPGLSGSQISELVAGATVEIDTPAGTKLPVRYTPEGRLSGEARDLAWYLGSAVDSGRWWVAGDQLCHKWFRWFNAEPQCMRIVREGRNFRWRTPDGNTGTAAIAIAAPAPVQASTLLALPRVFPKRIPEPAPAEAPPALAGSPPRLQDSAEAVAAATPPSPPAAREATAEANSAPPLLPATINPSPPPQAETKQPEIKVAAAPPTRPAAPAPAQVEPKRAADPLFKVANVRSDDVLNIRSGPSADFDVVGELPPDTRGIAVTSACRARWCPVQHHATSGWVNSIYLVPEESNSAPQHVALHDGPKGPPLAFRESPDAPRSCLTPAARALLDRIEQKFGPVKVMSTCRPGATIAGTGRPSRHASGNAVDFDAGPRKAAILEWLIATHRSGGIMTYAGMDHIHVDIGPRFISLAGGRHWSSWNSRREGSQATSAQR